MQAAWRLSLGSVSLGTQNVNREELKKVIEFNLALLSDAIAGLGGVPTVVVGRQDEQFIELAPGGQTVLAADDFFGYAIEVKGPDGATATLTKGGGGGTLTLEVETFGGAGPGFERYQSGSPTSLNYATALTIDAGATVEYVKVVRYYNV